MNSLLVFIVQNLAFLYGKLGFVFSNSVCDGAEGSALLELENGILLIQCVRDRGEVSVYLASLQNPIELFELSELLEIQTGQKLSYIIPISERIEFLQDHYNEIETLLVENLFVALEKRNEIRVRQLRSLGR